MQAELLTSHDCRVLAELSTTHVCPLELLKVVRETENEDLTGVLQKFVCAYGEEITPLAVEITTHLVRHHRDRKLDELDAIVNFGPE